MLEAQGLIPHMSRCEESPSSHKGRGGQVGGHQGSPQFGINLNSPAVPLLCRPLAATQAHADAEAVLVEYDADVVSYGDLLMVRAGQWSPLVNMRSERRLLKC